MAHRVVPEDILYKLEILVFSASKMREQATEEGPHLQNRRKFSESTEILLRRQQEN
jgi:hypothetical protein